MNNYDYNKTWIQLLLVQSEIEEKEKYILSQQWSMQPIEFSYSNWRYEFIPIAMRLV
jgi:hypothetical protein